VVDLKSFFNIVFYWAIALDFLNVLYCHDFFIVFFFLVWCFSCILLVYLSALFNDILIIHISKKIVQFLVHCEAVDIIAAGTLNVGFFGRSQV
jgi:hypothetical protein